LAGKLGEIARRHRATPSQVALAWLLQRSPVVLAHFGDVVDRAFRRRNLADRGFD